MEKNENVWNEALHTYLNIKFNDQLTDYADRMPKSSDADDPVNHPKHYTSGKIEVADFIADQKMNFFLGNVVKYVCRAGKKDPDKLVEDLEKAKWYLEREIRRIKEELE